MNDEYATKTVRVAVAKVLSEKKIKSTHKSCFDMLIDLAVNRTFKRVSNNSFDQPLELIL